MSEFDLERCIAGEAVENNNGEPRVFVAYDDNLRYPLVMRDGDSLRIYTKEGKNCALREYDLRMVDQKKKVDLSKLPVDTILNTTLSGYFAFSSKNVSEKLINVFTDGGNSYTCDDEISMPMVDISISPNQPWTFFQGGDCPIPDGLEFEVVFQNYTRSTYPSNASNALWKYMRSDCDIIAYRLTGKVLEGYEL